MIRPSDTTDRQPILPTQCRLAALNSIFILSGIPICSTHDVHTPLVGSLVNFPAVVAGSSHPQPSKHTYMQPTITILMRQMILNHCLRDLPQMWYENITRSCQVCQFRFTSTPNNYLVQGGFVMRTVQTSQKARLLPPTPLKVQMTGHHIEIGSNSRLRGSSFLMCRCQQVKLTNCCTYGDHHLRRTEILHHLQTIKTSIIRSMQPR